MKTVSLNSWEEFESEISNFMVSVETKRKQKHPLIGYVSNPLFRGHADASWGLETTLDRMTRSEYKMSEYHRVIRGVRPAVVSITGTDWNVPVDFVKTANPVPPGYEFMIYLRHHGFPSPLLDWSRSPYVAAFFAFRSKEHCDEEGNVAIYSFVEYLGEVGKMWEVSQPTIHGLGPYVVSHKRHYAQQCEYTICKKESNENDFYCSHETARTDDESQDHLTKYIIPKTERSIALKKLETMNVTAFSLFGSEESLMETLAYQELEKHLLEQRVSLRD